MIKANRSLSQNFMKNPSVIERVGESIRRDGAFSSMLEIGPGNGEFTDMLVEICGKRLVLVEKDDLLFEALQRKYSDSGVSLFHMDAREYEIKEESVFSSMPYSISKDLTKKIVLSPSVEHAYLIVQKEFGEKIENDDMSAISLLARTFFDVRKEFNIKKGSFSPAPKVDSCFIKMSRTRRLNLQPENYWDFLNMLTSNKLKKASFITGEEDKRRVSDLTLQEIVSIYADKNI